MQSPGSNPFLQSPLQPVNARLLALQLRTLLVAVAGVAALLGGFWLMADPLGRQVMHAYALFLGQGHLPPAHVPRLVDGYWGTAHLAFIALVLATVMGHSVGAFGQLKARWVMLLPLVVGVAIVIFAPPTMAGLNVVPSRLERDIMRGRYDAAEQALGIGQTRDDDRSEQAVLQHYVKAQIALRAKDELALRQHGQAVLQAADRYVFGLDVQGVVAQFRPELVHALDVAINAEPVSEVGMRVQREGKVLHGHSVLMDVARLVLGLALAVSLWPLMGLWNQMRRRIVRIQQAVAGGTSA